MDCRVRDCIGAGATTFPVPVPLGRRLGHGRHPLAGDDSGFSLTVLDESTEPPHVVLLRFSSAGVPVGAPVTIDDEALDEANPVVARLPGGASVVAWTAPDEDERGVWLRRVEANGQPGAPVRATTLRDFGQFAPDVLWDGSQLVVAWVDDGDLSTGRDVYVRTFSEDLKPQGEQVLAGTAATEGQVALAPFAGSWAAAWRSSADGLDTIRIRAGSLSWSFGPYVPGATEDAPALVAIDGTHLAVLFSDGAYEDGSNAPPVNRLQVAEFNTDSPGDFDSGESSILLTTLPDGTRAPSHPSLVAVQGELWASWRTAAAPGDAQAEELWLQPLPLLPSLTVLDLSAPAIPLPRQEEHRPGDQRRPAMAAVGSSLALAWEDLGRTFAPQGADREVIVELAPLPLLRLEDEVTP